LLETTELFKRQLGECAGADRFIGRRIGRLILICANGAATAGKHGLAPAATHNGIVGARWRVPTSRATVPSVRDTTAAAPSAKQRSGYKLQLGVSPIAC